MDERLYKLVNGVRIEMSAKEVAEHQQFQAQAQVESQRMAEEMERQRLLAEAELDAVAYSDRIVAYIDVLGWGELINRSVTQPSLLRVLGSASQVLSGFSKSIDERRKLFEREDEDGAQVTQFSDTIIISCPATAEGLSEITSSIWFLSKVFLDRDILIRGAIVQGQLYHQNSVVFGPALIEAWQAEKAARFPRITLQQTLAAQVGRGRSVYDPRTGETYHDKTWRVDPADGITFYDFMQPFGASTRVERLFSLEAYTQDMKALRHGIVTGLQRFSNTPSVCEKFIWLAGYLNSVVAEYPETGISSISCTPELGMFVVK
jgi:hypothetical protein